MWYRLQLTTTARHHHHQLPELSISAVAHKKDKKTLDIIMKDTEKMVSTIKATVCLHHEYYVHFWFPYLRKTKV